MQIRGRGQVADQEVSLPTDVIRPAIDFYCKEKYEIDFRELKIDEERQGPRLV
ncbi:MAG: hypothetical protein JSU72_18240 [Deltaproteobacteria bacterium]|nr:MAG: hypothetical protein JSU72_18240 [Deltaproteobacteria bacterium]